MEISVVSPVYKAEKIIDELVKRLTIELNKITSAYEIILVEDGSPDNSWQKIFENAPYELVEIKAMFLEWQN